MIQSRKSLRNQALKYAMAGVAVMCLGAAVFAAPLTITPKAKLFSAQQRSSETKSAYAPLGKGPAVSAWPSAAGEERIAVK